MTYFFRFRAMNSVGESDWSTVSGGIATRACPPEKPLPPRLATGGLDAEMMTAEASDTPLLPAATSTRFRNAVTGDAVAGECRCIGDVVVGDVAIGNAGVGECRY